MAEGCGLLRKLNVRTRLVAVIAVPLALLLAVAVPEAIERRGQADDADRAAGATEQVADVSAAVDALQLERTLSAAIRAGAGPEVEEALAVQRTITDDAVTRADVALVSLGAVDPAIATVAQVGTERTWPASTPSDPRPTRRPPTCRGRTPSLPRSTRCSWWRSPSER